MLVTLPDGWIVVLNVGVWFAWSASVGYAMHRLPVARFARDSRLTRLRPFETGGGWYERRLRIRRWKDRLPEAGALFASGFSKRHVARADLARYVAETRRAEVVHWVAMVVWPVFAIWNPPWAVGVMLGYALVANAPCLLVQRYNRARLVRILGRAREPAVDR